MGSITFQIVGDATVGTKTKTYQVTDADVNRILTAHAVGGLTIAQAALAWATFVINETKTRVSEAERRAQIPILPDIGAT